MNRYYLLIPFVLVSCEKVTLKELKPEVEKNLIVFNATEIPPKISSEVHNHRFIIFGETHYIQEHQELGSKLLEEVGNEQDLVFMNELSQAYSWMVEDYVSSELEEIFEHLRFFDQEWLENIKMFNSNATNNYRIKMHYIDFNHTEVDFRNSLGEIENIIGEQPIFRQIYADPFDSEQYKNSLISLKKNLVDNSDLYPSIWGQEWFNRISYMVEIELLSYEIRKEWNDNAREIIMYKNIKHTIDLHPNEKAFINVGMFHAQKTTLLGPGIQRVAQYLNQDFPGAVLSIAFVGIKGDSKYNYYDTNSISVDLLSETKKNDLIHIIGDAAGENLAFLSLKDEIFTRDMAVTYTNIDTKKLAPGLQFDAIISYPHISLLKSMKTFSYQ